MWCSPVWRYCIVPLLSFKNLVRLRGTCRWFRGRFPITRIPEPYQDLYTLRLFGCGTSVRCLGPEYLEVLGSGVQHLRLVGEVPYPLGDVDLSSLTRLTTWDLPQRLPSRLKHLSFHPSCDVDLTDLPLESVELNCETGYMAEVTVRLPPVRTLKVAVLGVHVCMDTSRLRKLKAWEVHEHLLHSELESLTLYDIPQDLSRFRKLRKFKGYSAHNVPECIQELKLMHFNGDLSRCVHLRKLQVFEGQFSGVPTSKICMDPYCWPQEMLPDRYVKTIVLKNYKNANLSGVQVGKLVLKNSTVSVLPRELRKLKADTDSTYDVRGTDLWE
jgi:hypothetical protein